MSNELIQDRFADRVVAFLTEAFGTEAVWDATERTHRFTEEALELAQSAGCTKEEAHQLVDYVFDRPVGEQWQEAGGVMLTLASLCNALGLDPQDCGERELVRAMGKIETIRQKHLSKPRRSPLPGTPLLSGSDGWSQDAPLEEGWYWWWPPQVGDENRPEWGPVPVWRDGDDGPLVVGEMWDPVSAASIGGEWWSARISEPRSRQEEGA